MSKKTKQLVYCGVLLSLAFITSLIRLFTLPFGGSITLFSMLFVVLAGYWFGTTSGIIVGILFGLLTFVQNPIFLNLPQFLLDYICSFAILGIAGLFQKKPNGLIKGYLISITGRGFFATIAGYAFWLSYMPENFPKSISFLYSPIYNFGYIFAEGILTVIIISIPAFKKALEKLGPTL